MKKIVDEELTDYDVRQIALMRKFVTDYEEGTISIANLINKLEGLLDCLQSVDLLWKESCYDNWLTLEESYALVLDKGDSIDKYFEYINNAISNLKNLLGMQMDQPPV